MGLNNEGSCSPKFLLNWAHILKEWHTITLLLDTESKGSGAPSSAGRDVCLEELTSIENQAGGFGWRWKCFQSIRALILAAQ